MIENNLLKTNFLGKDGFRWWIGQVAPEAAQGNQINQIGNTWGTRMKVRIYGYHPADLTELADEDLPWAQVLLSPQCGSGKANRARSLSMSLVTLLWDFFLMVMMHNFQSSWEYSPALLIIMVEHDDYKAPFVPFTGYTSKIKPNNDFIAKNEGGDDSSI